MLITYAQLLEGLIKMLKQHPDHINKPLAIQVDDETFITYDAPRVDADGRLVIVVQTIEDSD